MSETTATVETLTAEVRALMVGNRQVTLSVYRQLDIVEPEWIVPFGRTNDAKDCGGGIYVVGRHVEAGTLVRAWMPRPDNHARWDHVDGLLQPWCSYGRGVEDRYSSRTYSLVQRIGKFQVSLKIPDKGLDWDLPEKAIRYTSLATEEFVRCWATQEIELMVQADREYAAWGGLPLIVLAGLR